jgi:peptidoglycan hydrolase-like protein with peptidoglycan-binding domain
MNGQPDPSYGAGAYGGGGFSGGGGGGSSGGGGDGGDVDWGDGDSGGGGGGGGAPPDDGYAASDAAASSFEDQFDQSYNESANAEGVMGSYMHGCDVLGADVIPSAGATYTDHDTVLAVQGALKARGFDPGPLDGIYGPKTGAAIRKMQAAVGAAQSGEIDYGVLAALNVSASSAGTSPSRPSIFSPVQFASYAQVVPGAPGSVPVPSLAPTFWSQPLWAGAPVKRWQGAVGAAAAAALAVGFAMVRR